MPPKATTRNRERFSIGPFRAFQARYRLFAILLLIVLATLYTITPSLTGYYLLQRGAMLLDRAETDAEAPTKATRDLQRAAVLLPANPHPLRYLARAYQATERWDEAIATLEQLDSLMSDSVLVRTELMLAYQAAGRFDHAMQLAAALGYPPDELAIIGDAYRREGDHIQALRWYATAVEGDPALAPQLAFRRLVSAGPANDPQAQALLRQAQTEIPDLELPTVGASRVVVPGAVLRWVEAFPQNGVTYGTPLNYPHHDSEGVFWWNGHATLLLRVAQYGNYLVQVTILNSYPPPVELTLGANGMPLHGVSLSSGDNSWSVVEFPVVLTTSLASIDVWFTNDATVQGHDRNASIAQVEILPIAK